MRCFALVCLLSVYAATASCAEPSGRMHAVLIGVDEYYRDVNLRFSTNDVELLEYTLREFCGCTSFRVMTQRSHRRDQPDYGKILGVLQDEVKIANSGHFDSLLVFFAGHGLRDAEDGQLYIAPADYVPNLLKETGVRVSFVKQQLAKCDNVRTKYLVLDTCHAAARPTGSEIAAQLEGTPGLITFASCRPGEESIEWSECGHGLFTYWFCVGLSGWADGTLGERRAGVTDVGELHHFAGNMVSRTLQTLAKRKGQAHNQHPELIAATSDAPLATLKAVAREADLTQTLERADKLIRSNLPQAAIDVLDQGMKLSAWDPELCAWRGKAYVHLFEKTTQRQHLEKALADLDTAIMLSQIRPRQNDNVGEFLQRRNDILERLGVPIGGN